MLSRVADSIYWMAKYVERAENLARFIDVTLNLMLDDPSAGDMQWQPLVNTTGDAAFFAEHYGIVNQENVIRFLAFDRTYRNSIISTLWAARENARTIRETVSSEAWEQLNECYHYVNEAAANSDAVVADPSDFFRTVKHQNHLFNGTLDATMSHGKGWHFANVGRLLERADKTSRILDVKYFTLLPSLQDMGTTIDDLQWSAVLRSVSGFEMFRKQFHSITVRRIVEFLILDREFPRAVQFCIVDADRSLHMISGSPIDTYHNAAERRLGQLRSELAFCDVESIVQMGLHQFVDGLQTKLNRVGEAIFDTFIAIRPAGSETTGERGNVFQHMPAANGATMSQSASTTSN